MKRKILLLIVLLVVIGSAGAGETIPVSCSIPPIAAIAREVGGDLVTVEVLLPPGASPHGFAPTPDAVRKMAKAVVHLVVGRSLDLWAESLARGANPEARIERLAHDLPGPEPEADHSHHDHDHHDHDHELDPHIWLDPLKAAAVAGHIGEIFSRLRPEYAERFSKRAEATRERYEKLEASCAEKLAPVRDVPFVTYHGGLAHLVTRFGLRQEGVIEPFPGREPSPRYMKEIIERIRDTGVRAVFSEPQTSSKLAEVVGKETGIEVAEIDPIGGVAGRMTYSELLESCVDVLSRTLSSSEGNER